MQRQEQAELRYAAAGLIKSLIRARCRQEPDFLPIGELQRWGVSDVAAENRPCAQLLTRVRQLRERFERKFLAGEDSIPAPSSVDEAEAIDTVFDRTAAFIHGDLEEAIRAAVRGEVVAWQALADWSQLAALRDALDRLPQKDKDSAGDEEASEESDADRPQEQDGPVPPDEFIYRGVTYQVPAGVVYRLIDALWHAPRRRLLCEDLAELVWQDQNAESTPGQIASARTRANAAFRKHRLSFQVKIAKGWVRLVETDTEEPTEG